MGREHKFVAAARTLSPGQGISTQRTTDHSRNFNFSGFPGTVTTGRCAGSCQQSSQKPTDPFHRSKAEVTPLHDISFRGIGPMDQFRKVRGSGNAHGVYPHRLGWPCESIYARSGIGQTPHKHIAPGQSQINGTDVHELPVGLLKNNGSDMSFSTPPEALALSEPTTTRHNWDTLYNNLVNWTREHTILNRFLAIARAMDDNGLHLYGLLGFLVSTPQVRKRLAVGLSCFVFVLLDYLTINYLTKQTI